MPNDSDFTVPDLDFDTSALDDALAGLGGGGPTNAELDEMGQIDPTDGGTPDPLADVDYTGDLEVDAKAELNAMQQGFRDRAKAENERFIRAVDSEFWVCLCFRSREDKEAFLQAANLLKDGDKYLSGYLAAERLGVQFDAEPI